MAANPMGLQFIAPVSRRAFDDPAAVPLTWNRMVEDMRRSVERFRQAVNNGDRSEFVRRAENMSDHLRLLFAAGSGTTDNHSGNPSIISTNKALYPHFRETMSRFSKLVLSSHIAAADWPPPDSYSKCLKEADGVLNGVYGFVEVARQQRGEEIPRLVPGFVANGFTGGSWHNNGLTSRDPTSFASLGETEESEPIQEPTATLDSKLLERLDNLRQMIVTSLRRLEDNLFLIDKIVTPSKHRAIGDSICNAGSKVLEFYRPWISTVESINLASLGNDFQEPALNDFSVRKQRVYDLVSDLIIACQATAAPVADEWAEVRGDSLEDRINHVRLVSRDLESCTSPLYVTPTSLRQP